MEVQTRPSAAALVTYSRWQRRDEDAKRETVQGHTRGLRRSPQCQERHSGEDHQHHGRHHLVAGALDQPGSHDRGQPA
jgi:hypothetical protein